MRFAPVRHLLEAAAIAGKDRGPGGEHGRLEKGSQMCAQQGRRIDRGESVYRHSTAGVGLAEPVETLLAIGKEAADIVDLEALDHRIGLVRALHEAAQELIPLVREF